MKKGLLKMVATLICTMTCALGLVACRDNTTKTSESNEVQIRQTYQEIYGKMSDLLMDTAISSMTPVSKLSIRKCNNTVLYATFLVAEDEIYTEAVTNSTWFIGATTYVYLAAELYKNDTFIVTDSPVGYTITPESAGTVAHTDVIMMSNMNVETGEVLLQLEFETTEYREGVPYSDKNYIYIDANYDFTKKRSRNIAHSYMEH